MGDHRPESVSISINSLTWKLMPPRKALSLDFTTLLSSNISMAMRLILVTGLHKCKRISLLTMLVKEHTA